MQWSRTSSLTALPPPSPRLPPLSFARALQLRRSGACTAVPALLALLVAPTPD
jgi:hypothetical protein